MIRRGLLLPILIGAGFLLFSSLASAKKVDDPKWCRACHQQKVFSPEQWKLTVHNDMNCRECHTSYHFNPHEPVKEAKSEAITALSKIAKKDPAALAACHDCHDELVAGKFIHGALGAKKRAKLKVKLAPKAKSEKKTTSKKDKVKGHARVMPYCDDCHGNLHGIREAKKMKSRARRMTYNARCLACHGDHQRMKAAGFTKDFAHSYGDSIHARKLELGSQRAPGCVDCHGGHKQVDVKKGMAARCKKCHPKANEAFATLVTHKKIKAKPVSYYTQKFFAWLTFITIFLLSMHVLIDLFAALRRGLKGSGQGTEA